MSSRNMRLLPWAALHSDSEQVWKECYWVLEKKEASEIGVIFEQLWSGVFFESWKMTDFVIPILGQIWQLDIQESDKADSGFFVLLFIILSSIYCNFQYFKYFEYLGFCC